MYYSIIEKETGIMQNGSSNYSDHTDRPLHDSLAYAPLNDELVKQLVSNNPDDHIGLKPIDFQKTYFDQLSNQWVIIYLENIFKVNPVEETLKVKDQLLKEASKKLNIPDLSDSARKKMNDYIIQISNINVVEGQTNNIVWPQPPF